jgi:hypothetical protein
MRTDDLNLIADLPGPQFRAILKRLTKDELQELFDHVASRPPSEPRERLAWFAKRERQRGFMRWVRTLPVTAMQGVYMRILAGDPIDRIRAEFGATER